MYHFGEDDFTFFKKIILSAGKLALNYQKKGLEINQKSDMTVVTQADLAVQDFLITKISDRYHNFKFIYEENFEKNIDLLDDDSITIIIDPIDGTAIYSMYLPFWCVSVAIFKGTTPLYGFIYSPETNMFFYNDNKASYLNSNPVSVSDYIPLEKETNMLSASELQGKLSINFPGKIRNFGSTALHAALVTNNKKNRIMLFVGKAYLWDWAAAIPIVLTAGGKISYLSGKKIDFQGVVKNNYKFKEFVIAYSGIEFKKIQDFFSIS